MATFRTRSFLAIAGVLILAALGALSFISKKNAPENPVATLSRYNNPHFGVSLEYPSSWQADPRYAAIQGVPNRYEGADGFFGIDAVTDNENHVIDDAAKTFAYHDQKPYGSSPVIEVATIDGEEARFVIPSSDQPETMRRESVLVVRYRTPVTIGTTTYGYLVLYADRFHLRSLAESLRLLQ